MIQVATVTDTILGDAACAMQLAKLTAYGAHAAIQHFSDLPGGQAGVSFEELKHRDFTAILCFLRFRRFHE
ncbi:hypothetical protein ASV26_08380 [Klebsiella aerogenes]|nr:hypothetical protein ASV26_08380 [Klebsiella aerogenes]